MKNFILSCAMACVATFACINNTYAQASKFGIKAGATLTTMGSANDGTSYDYRLGFQGGVFAVTPISDKVDFMPQVLYSQKGGNAKESLTVSGNTITAKTETRIDYLDVPFLFGLKAQPNLTFTLGPQASFLLSQKTTFNVSGNGNSQNGASTSTDGLRKTVIGGNLGAIYTINKNLGLNFNYMLDFQRMGDNNAGASATEKNSGFVLSLSYLF